MASRFPSSKAAHLIASLIQRTGENTAREIEFAPLKLYNETQRALEFALPTMCEATPETMLHDLYNTMYIREMEVSCDVAYKQRKIRGFCHLYNGQEGVAVGVESALKDNDLLVSSYRSHAWHVLRGGTAFEVFSELLGKHFGCCKGKGGSMHLCKVSANYYGANGIVGAQVPHGIGLALSLVYDKWKDRSPEAVSVTVFGDGAVTQGQVWEAYNMAALWKLPCLFICENNQFSMGTPLEGHSANAQIYTQCRSFPGVQVDGMDVFSVRAATRWARDWALKGNGPVLLELKCYRYSGHSMSDPGTTYRSKSEVRDIRRSQDCIERLKKHLVADTLVTSEGFDKIESHVREAIAEEYAQADAGARVQLSELETDT